MTTWDEQRGLDELTDTMHDTTFCVVDLETTGGSPTAGAAITEVGAVKVRGGEVVGEFQTLVDPLTAIPPQIRHLTGITDRMVAGQPTIESVLPAFLEFAHGSVLVAHNAPFDVGFLKHACRATERPWPRFPVVDTAVLARQVFTRDEAPNCRLGTLARVVRSETTPNHRALADAQATVDVLHEIIARLGNQGVHTLDELVGYTSAVRSPHRGKRSMADRLPAAPGVYLFKDVAGRVLYIGKSVDLRKRVRSYFTAGENRKRITEMLGIASSVDGIQCATALEAEVRELRLIALHKPPYNRRSKFPEKQRWIKITDEPWPRLSIVAKPRDDGCSYLGPFHGAAAAERARDAIHGAFPVRQCSGRLARSPTQTPCTLAELGRCLSPCDGSADPATYRAVVRTIADAFIDPADVISRAARRIDRLSVDERFEAAARERDRCDALTAAVLASRRAEALRHASPLVVAAQEPASGTWQVNTLVEGQLATSACAPGSEVLSTAADQLRAADGSVMLPESHSSAEASLIARWLEAPGVRVVQAPVLGWATAHLPSPGRTSPEATAATLMAPLVEPRIVGGRATARPRSNGRTSAGERGPDSTTEGAARRNG